MNKTFFYVAPLLVLLLLLTYGCISGNYKTILYTCKAQNFFFKVPFSSLGDGT
ncbi:hypothetical protein [Pedobacter caeni]|uniref:hypothetical protein n=1 Tax=Pedobacter caeni TaxID=288992 RepID=UPI00135659D1|nr:hypothetical protein [Pedobacter caeni]